MRLRELAITLISSSKKCLRLFEMKNIVSRNNRITKFIKYSFVILSIFLCSTSIYTKQTTVSDEEQLLITWKKELKDKKIPKNAIKLKYLYSIPDESDPVSNSQDIFLKSSSHMDINRNGNAIYLSDSTLNRILAFDSDGNYLRNFGQPGNGPGELMRPTQVCVSSNGDVIVNNMGNGRIEIFTSEGKFKSSFKAYKGYTSIKEYSNKLYTTPRNSVAEKAFLIDVVDFSGDLISQFGELTKYNDKNNQLNEVMLCIGGEDRLYVAWRAQNILRRYSTTGKMLMEINIDQSEIMKNNTRVNRENAKETGSNYFRYVINAMAIENKSVYLMTAFPRIEIVEITEQGSVGKIYYADQKINGIYEDMIVREKDGKKYFYILEGYPDNCINVYTK